MNTMAKITFTLTPREDGSGFNLTGEPLPGPLWYTKFEDAESYAAHAGRGRACELRVLNERGEVIETRGTRPRRRSIRKMSPCAITLLGLRWCAAMPRHFR